MPKAEWRLFLPTDSGGQLPLEAQTMLALVDHVSPAPRTDIYIKADADVGVKRRGGGGLEFKALKERKTVGDGVKLGVAETFGKVRLGEGATTADVLEHLRKEETAASATGRGDDKAGGAVSKVLEALMTKPLEVNVEKSVRKVDVDVSGGKGKASFEATDVTVGFVDMPEGTSKKWLTFCAEGSLECIEAFLKERGEPLVALLSRSETHQVGYPRFVEMVSTPRT